jgi:hypothetical protein
MGLVGRTLDFLNHVDLIDPIFRDRRTNGGDRVLERGEQRSGRLVGIERKLDGGTDEQLMAFEATGLGEPAGTRLTGPHLHRLRLGMPLLLRVDDAGRAVLDWPALCAAWGLEPGLAGQRLLKKPPGPGLVDKALDIRVQSRLRKWTRTRATIASLQRRTVMGMLTDDYDVGLELEDGGRAAASQHVPFYACWLAAPGATVPVAVEPGRPDRACIDWPAAALEAADRAGMLQDAPPEGSVAATIDADRARA